jgi:hypothetical protein
MQSLRTRIATKHEAHVIGAFALTVGERSPPPYAPRVAELKTDALVK